MTEDIFVLKAMMVVMVTMDQMELKAMMVQTDLLVLRALLAPKAHLAEEEGGPVFRLQKMVHQLGP